MAHSIHSTAPNHLIDSELGLYVVAAGDVFAASNLLWAYEELLTPISTQARSSASAPTAKSQDLVLGLMMAPMTKVQGVAVAIAGEVAFVARSGGYVALVRNGEVQVLEAASMVVELLPGDWLVVASFAVDLTNRDFSAPSEEFGEALLAGGRKSDSVLLLKPSTSHRARLAQARAQALGNLFLFQDLSFEQRLLVQRISGQRSVGAGERVISAGERGDTMYLVVQGELEVSLRGKRLTTLGPGQHFGELALADDAPRSADVNALERSELMTFQRGELERFCEEYPMLGLELTRRIVRCVAARVRVLSEQVSQS